MAKKSITERLVRRVFYKYFARNLLFELQMRARADSADYVQDHMGKAVIVEDHSDLLRLSVARAPADGLILEFGVAGGTSINIIADATSRTVYGFDSFEGLPWSWGGALETEGAFSRRGQMPKVRANVELVKGLFSETIADFGTAHPGDIAFLHVDCDLYQSTVDILTGLGHRLRSGSIILFDEYLNYPGWRHHEYKAWQEFVTSHNLSYEYLAFSARDGQALVRLVDAAT
jgi:predicted O-methyltransferase YrrM